MYLWEQFSSQMVHHLTSPAVFVPFWTGSFLIVGYEEGTHSLVPLFCRFDPFGFFFWLFVKDVAYREKVENVNELRDRTVRAAECVNNEMLTNGWQDTVYLLGVCRTTLMVPILRLLSI
jgi:hypothetical protein